MLMYHNCTTFLILDLIINLYSEKLGDRHNTVAEMEDRVHYLGNELPNITSAIFAWEDLNGRLMTKEELRQVLKDNDIL